MNRSRVWRALTSPATIDAAVAVLVAILAYRVVYRSLHAYYHIVPWIEDLLVPCTGRPGWVPDLATLRALPQWQAFLDQKLEYFPCSAIAGLPLSEIGISWQRQEYFHVALGTWFRIIGPTINGFVTFQAAMFAVTCAVAYLTFRLGMWRPVALACTAGLVWSPLHLWSAGLPIEYAKAPFILATVGLCGLVLRRDEQEKSIWVPAFAAGLVAGIGIGFKTDVLAAVPLAMGTTLVFVGWRARGWSTRAIATLCVVAGVVIGGGAMIQRNFFSSQGSLFPIQILGGQDWATEALHAESPLYDYGLLFDDSHITVLINDYGHRVLGTTGTAFFFSREMQDMANRVLLDMWSTFPGDLVLRVIAAAMRVMQLNGLWLSIAVPALFAVFATNLRAGWFITAVTVYLSVFASLVFQRRHVFHLEFISWGLAGLLAQIMLTAPRRVWGTGAIGDVRPGLARSVVRAALCLSVIGVSGVAVLFAARSYQHEQMLRLAGEYQQVPQDERTIERASDAPDGAMLRVKAISLRDREPSPDPFRMASDYLVVKFRCRDDRPIRFTATYLPPAAAWNRGVSVPCSASGSVSQAMIAVHQYEPTYVFDGLAMSGEAADAVLSVSTMRQDSRARLWLDLFMPADWATRDWVERLRVPPLMPPS